MGWKLHDSRLSAHKKVSPAGRMFLPAFASAKHMPDVLAFNRKRAKAHAERASVKLSAKRKAIRAMRSLGIKIQEDVAA